MWGSVRRTPGVLRPSTLIFADLDVDRVAINLDLEKKGTERGSLNEPGSTAAGSDDVELAIIERIEEEKKSAHHLVEDEMQAFSERLTNLDFDGQFVMIKQANATIVTDFIAEVEGGIDELHGLRRALAEAEDERTAL